MDNNSKSTTKKVMKLWKKSKGHYSNLLLSEHLCGAIATDGHTWCAIFFNISAKSIDSFREKNESLIPVTIKIFLLQQKPLTAVTTTQAIMFTAMMTVISGLSAVKMTLSNRQATESVRLRLNLFCRSTLP